MTPLAQFQQGFWSALFGPTETWGSQPAFAVYRNTVFRACTDAIVARFPSVLHLVGEEWLRAAAHAFVQQHPPHDARLLLYGDDFPAFLAGFAPAADLPWLGAVAQRDAWWTHSHTAADAMPLNPAFLASVAPDTLPGLRLMPHPAARWHWCAEWPAHSLWSAAREGHPNANPPHWHGEGTLITRPHDSVVSCPIGAGACALLDACAQGHPIPEALAHAMAHEPDLDPAATIALLLQQGAFQMPQP